MATKTASKQYKRKSSKNKRETYHTFNTDTTAPPTPSVDEQKVFKFSSWNEFIQASWKNRLLFLNRWLWVVLGRVLGILYALGCALTMAAAAMAFVFGVSGVMWPAYSAAGIVFVCGFIFNNKITFLSTPKVLLDFFGRGKLFKGLFEYTDKEGVRHQLTKIEKKWLIYGVFCALASAGMWAAIGWEEIIVAFSLIFSISTAAVPPVLLIVTAIILAGLAVATATMLIKEISNMLGKHKIVDKVKSIWEKIKNVFNLKYFKKLKKKHPKPKAFFKALCADALTVLIIGAVISLTLTGLVMLMKTGAASLQDYLVATFNMNSIVANVIGIVNCFVFALSGELPFAINTSVFAGKYLSNKIKKKLGITPASRRDGVIERN